MSFAPPPRVKPQVENYWHRSTWMRLYLFLLLACLIKSFETYRIKDRIFSIKEKIGLLLFTQYFVCYVLYRRHYSRHSGEKT